MPPPSSTRVEPPLLPAAIPQITWAALTSVSSFFTLPKHSCGWSLCTPSLPRNLQRVSARRRAQRAGQRSGETGRPADAEADAAQT